MTSSENLLHLLESKLGNYLLEKSVGIGCAVVVIDRSHAHEFFPLLKLDNELAFEMLLSVTAVDWLDERDDRYEVVYHFLSLSRKHRLRVKISLAEDDATVPSLVSLWESANFMERETFDMYGVKFSDHPDLRRILMYDEFVGYPLRKDYPVQGKQPRIPLRSPEVENTARKMQRAPLVQIGGFSRGGESHEGMKSVSGGVK